MSTLMCMLAFDDALAKLLSDLPRPSAERVFLSEALGRVLAEDVHATQALPPFDYSAMDGYALCSADLTDTLTLPVSQTVSAGSAPTALPHGSAVRIFTGGPIPRGADCVVMQENAERQGMQLRILQRPAPGAHIRRAGEDLQQGALALSAGSRLTAFHLGLIASLDLAQVLVAKRPEVSIVCTGDELRLPGSAGAPGSIPESNSIAIEALVRGAGGVVHHCPSTSDEPQATRDALDNALGLAQVVVSVGGVSVGERDIVRSTLEALGVSTRFHKVAIKPGKPLYYGVRGEQRILGLPGNPASAQVTFAMFGVPLLRALQGASDPLPQRTRATLTHAIRQKPGRLALERAKLADGKVTPLNNQASGATTGMAWANALVLVPATTSELAAGEHVDVIRLDEF